MRAEDGWFPVALAADIDPSTSAGTRLFGRELVVWRDEAGQSHVWEDRCPHRGMRLSFGFVRGTHIACLYHGWQFDAAGRCRYIPAHPRLEVPATIAVERYASSERLGFVWAFAGADAEATAPPGTDADVLPVRSIAMAAPTGDAVAALRAAPSPFADDGVARTEGAGPLLTLRSGGMSLHVAVQPVADASTTLHLAASPAPGLDRQRVSLWAEGLRRAAEAAPRRGAA